MTKKLMIKFRWLLLFVICATAFAAKEYGVRSASETETPAAQDIMSLDRRINSLEQRLYGIESNISRLQQQMITSSRSTPAPISRDPEVDQLRNEIEVLKGRVRELECGMAHLDERTLSAGAKTRRGTGEQAKEPCRLNPEQPLPIKVRQ
jgi:predicted  nucleic acid-binding Zn-ribbon protein